jgi:hypothetical protein
MDTLIDKWMNNTQSVSVTVKCRLKVDFLGRRQVASYDRTK